MSVVFHPMRKIEIIVKGERKDFVRDLLENAGVTGYTLIKDVAGMGHTGYHEAKLLFNDQATLVMFIAVARPETIDEVADGLYPLFEKHSGVMFLSDTQVARIEKFTPKPESETGS